MLTKDELSQGAVITPQYGGGHWDTIGNLYTAEEWKENQRWIDEFTYLRKSRGFGSPTKVPMRFRDDIPQALEYLRGIQEAIATAIPEYEKQYQEYLEALESSESQDMQGLREK